MGARGESAESRLEHGRIYARVSGNGGTFQAGKFRDFSAAPKPTAWLFTTNAQTCCMRFSCSCCQLVARRHPAAWLKGLYRKQLYGAMDIHDGFCTPWHNTRSRVCRGACRQPSARNALRGERHKMQGWISANRHDPRIIDLAQDPDYTYGAGFFCGRRLAFL